MRLWVVLLAGWAWMVCGCQSPGSSVSPNAGAGPAPWRDVLGSSHVKGNYYFGSQDSLNEGADRLLAMGSRVIKVWFYNGSETPAVTYRWNADWPEVNSLVEGAQLPPWRAFFAKPFSTFILQVMEMVPQEDYYWRLSFSAEQEQEVERQFYELARHFLTTYQGTGKTFVLCNHESDWHLKGVVDWDAETPEPVFANAIRWFAARQRGVTRARRDVGMHGVRVFHAGEVVHVLKSLHDGQDNMVNRILPKVPFDLVSYSAYDATVIGGIHPPDEIVAALNYIEKHAIDSPHFGKKNVFVGEFGLPENEHSPETMMALTRNVVEKARAWGCPYIVYWQLYCNEPRPGATLPTWDPEQQRGWWLVRPDESVTPVYEYFAGLCRP